MELRSWGSSPTLESLQWLNFPWFWSSHSSIMNFVISVCTGLTLSFWNFRISLNYSILLRLQWLRQDRRVILSFLFSSVDSDWPEGLRGKGSERNIMLSWAKKHLNNRQMFLVTSGFLCSSPAAYLCFQWKNVIKLFLPYLFHKQDKEIRTV